MVAATFMGGMMRNLAAGVTRLWRDTTCCVVDGVYVGGKNHGSYLKCVTTATAALRKTGAIGRRESGAIVRAAARSGVNKGVGKK